MVDALQVMLNDVLRVIGFCVDIQGYVAGRLHE